MSGAIEVLEVGGSVLVQDLGRPGLAHLGVSPSGAADRRALRAANRALGNDDGAAALEVIGELAVRARDEVLVALSGARVSVVVDGETTAAEVVALGPGQVVRIGEARWGLRTYLAVQGGLDVPEVLGSRSTDVLSGLGPPPVRVGDVLAASPGRGRLRTSDGWGEAPSASALTMLDAGPGPRADWAADIDALYTTPWRVSPLADRVGVRLIGDPLERAVTAELPSEGVVTGSVQLPPSGEPVILGPDHPVTGGYPVIAVLTASACDAVAQLRTGATVRFRRAGAGSG
jgi:biotin-dependent carboxylase-like uncharacterized protein